MIASGILRSDIGGMFILHSPLALMRARGLGVGIMTSGYFGADEDSLPKYVGEVRQGKAHAHKGLDELT